MAKKKQAKPKKETTIDDLATSVDGLRTTVDNLATNVDSLATTVDDLATMTARGFERVDKRMDDMSDELKGEIAELRTNLKGTRQDVLNIGDRFVPRYEFDNLLMRVGKLEQKETKSKRK